MIPVLGDSLSLCCVSRKGGAAAAWQSVVTCGEPTGPGVLVVFWRGRVSGFSTWKLVDLPWSSMAIHCFWGMVTCEFLAAFSYPQNPFV